MFNIYTSIQFSSLVPDWKGISTSVIIDAPPGRAHSNTARRHIAFWESMSGKRLSQGGLIALVWQSGRWTTVHLGIIASSSRELTESVQQNMDYLKLRIVFFDPEIELCILQDLRNNKTQPSQFKYKFLVESPVMFETIRPLHVPFKPSQRMFPFPVILSTSLLASLVLSTSSHHGTPTF